jgi:DnaJ-class molecular chaperone
MTRALHLLEQVGLIAPETPSTPRTRACPACAGDGLVLADDDLAHRCTYCNGRGRIEAP